MTKAQKVIIIGLDGATWKLLGPWIEKGELPTFKKLMQKGVYGTLKSTMPCKSSLAIPSFYTGKNPGKLGLFNFSSLDSSVVNYKKIRETNKSIWDILGKYGYKSAIFNVPTTYPPVEINGLMASGFAPREEDEWTYPKDFKKNIRGFHVNRVSYKKIAFGKMTIKNEEKLFNLYMGTAKKRYELIRDTIIDKAFDFSIFWIDESDAVQHWFWRKKEYLLVFFQEMDKILKDILENCPNSNIIVMSDHGFDAIATYNFYPKSWLKKENYLKLKGNKIQQWLIQKINAFSIIIPQKYIRFFYSIYNKNKKRHKNMTEEEIKRGHPHPNFAEEDRQKTKTIGIDWKKTVAYNHDFWGIKIIRENLDRDYEELREEIIEKLKKLTDKNNQKIIRDIWKREEIFGGEEIQKIPDIIYRPTAEFFPSGYLFSQITGRKKSKHSGDHLTIREGIFIAVGPDIESKGEIGEVSILDVAPTVLYAFQVPRPEDMDGRALKEIFKSDLNLTKAQ